MDLVSEGTARRCNLPAHSLAQSLRLRFADGRQNARIGKVTGVKCQFQSEMGTIDTVWDFYVGPVHHDVILGMPWVTQWKACMRPLQATIEVCAPGDEERVPLPALPTTRTSSNVSGVEPVHQRNEENTAPRQPGVAAEAGGEKHTPRPNGDGKGALLEDSLHLTPEEQQKWESLKKEFADVLNNNELPAGRPPAGRLMHRIEPQTSFRATGDLLSMKRKSSAKWANC